MLRRFSGPVRSIPVPRGSRAAATWPELAALPRAYVSIVSVLGFAVVAWSLPVVAQDNHALLAVLFCLTMLTSLVKVTLPGTASTLSMSDGLGYLALFTLGTRSAVLVIAAGAWSQCTFRISERPPTHRTLFSIASLAVAMQLSGIAYQSLGGTPGEWHTSTALLPFAAAATVFFVLNTGLIAGAVGLTTTQPLGRLWCDTFLSTWPAYLLGAAVSGASVFAIQREALWLVLFLTVGFGVAFYNLRAYLEEVDEAATDALTTLSNQRFGLAHAERELARAKRNGTGMTIIAGDLDGLKTVNDTYGHRAGDLVLRDVAHCIQGCLRSYDVCARHGGDEFLVVLSDCDAAQGQARALELQAAVGVLEVEVRPSVLMPVGISIGVAAYPDDHDSLERLLETADARMYGDKVRRASLRQRLAPQP
jgi:diguanylate cyclase (GGDEF)-like protein